jgi:hypothetical protein
MELFICAKNHVNVLRSHMDKQNTLNLKIAWKLQNEINKIIQNVKLLKKMIYTVKGKMGIAENIGWKSHMPPKHLPSNEQALVRDYVKV